MIKNKILFKYKTNKKVFSSKKKQYPKITGSLIFFIIKTKWNIIFAIFITSYFAKNLSHQHIEAIKTEEYSRLKIAKDNI